MKGLLVVCKRQTKGLWQDGMMMAMIPVPFLAVFAINQGIPYLNELLEIQFGKVNLLQPYYLIFDLLMVALVPIMLCSVYSMTLLTEFDDKVANYLVITPVGVKGYLTSSLLIPSIVGSIISILLISFFSLTSFTISELVVLFLFGLTLSLISSLLILGMSQNKVEGVAYSKFTSIFILGFPAPFFLASPIQYVASVLPSFWVTKYLVEDAPGCLLGFVVTTIVWLIVLFRKFYQKLQ